MTNRRRDGRRTGQAIDWPAVRALYVEGRAADPDGDPNLRTWPTQADVALTFGISGRAIATRSARESWTAQRDEFQHQVDRARREASAAATGEKVASIERRALTTADAGLALIGHRMGFLVQGEIARGGNAGQGVNAQELAALGLAARRWVQVKDQVTGRPVEAESSEDLERDARLAEQVLAARLAEHVAAALAGDLDDLA